MKLTIGAPQVDSNTVALYRLDETDNTTPTSTTFSYTGGDQSYTVPAGVTTITTKMWGAGGGGGAPGGWSYGYVGGGGGYTTGSLNVSPGQVLTVMVGQGGNKGNPASSSNTYGGGGYTCNSDCQYSASGGGRSAIRYNSADLITAGGGGGGGSTTAYYGNEIGGAGGGLTGQNGGSGQGCQGTAGTQSAGGAGGTCSYSGSAGLQYLGGHPNSGSYGGGGGGGWYGGGAGSYGASSMAGGSGGSGYFGEGATGMTMTGSSSTPANQYDADRGSVGNGGAVNTNGNNGMVIVSYNVPKVTDATYGGYRGYNSAYVDTGAVPSDGFYGKARRFNNTARGRIILPDIPTTGSKYTLEACVKTDTYSYLGSFGPVVSKEGSYMIGLNTSGQLLCYPGNGSSLGSAVT